MVEGNRVMLREYRDTDFEDYYRLASDPVTRSLSLLNTPQSREDALCELQGILDDRKNENRKRFIFGVFTKSDDRYIGDAGLYIIKESSSGGIAEIGYFLDKAYWGQGLATESASLLIDFCFTRLPVHKVIASCDKRNTASERVMIRCGMTKEGELRKNRCKGDDWLDELKYGILKDEWRTRSHA